MEGIIRGRSGAVPRALGRAVLRICRTITLFCTLSVILTVPYHAIHRCWKIGDSRTESLVCFLGGGMSVGGGGKIRKILIRVEGILPNAREWAFGCCSESPEAAFGCCFERLWLWSASRLPHHHALHTFGEKWIHHSFCVFKNKIKNSRAIHEPSRTASRWKFPPHTSPVLLILWFMRGVVYEQVLIASRSTSRSRIIVPCRIIVPFGLFGSEIYIVPVC